MNENTNFLGTIINVADFGAVGDGISDDTTAIYNAVQQVNTVGGCLYFPTGKYKLIQTTANQKFINIQSNKNIIIDFNNSEIALQANSYTGYNIIYINNEAQTIIKNGYLVGDRLNHDYNSIESTHEFGYGIFISQKNVTIENMNISQMTGDAIVTKNGIYGGKIDIKNCDLSYCRRQGISILDSDNVTISDTDIHNIGTWNDVAGTSPMSGIDIEAASGSFNVNKVTLNNVRIKDVTKVSLICPGNCSELNLHNCTLNSGINIKCPATINNCSIDKKYISDIPYYLGSSTNISNSLIRLSVDSIFWLYASCTSCNIECLSGVGCGVYLTGKMIKCIIKNFGDDATQKYIAFKPAIGNTFKNIIDCTFENCAISGVEKEYFCPEGIIFKNCTIRVSEGGYIKNCNFYDCRLFGNICQIDCYDSYFNTVPFINTYNHFYHCTIDIPSAAQEQFCVQSNANYNMAVDTIFKINGECHQWAFKHLYATNGMRFIRSIIELPSYEKSSIDLLLNEEYNDVIIIYKGGVL